MKPKIDIFRPIAAVTRGCRGVEADESIGGQLHCTIFRKKRQGSSRSGQSVVKASSDESFVLSFPAEAWPPAAIPASESTDTKSTAERQRRNLNRSVPIQVESSESRGAGTPILSHQHPSYYKIEMQGSQVQLSAGDDNSIQIAPDHNDNIQSAGARNGSITRASPIADQSLESPDLPLKAHEMGLKWTVSENGDIVAIPSSNNPAPSTPTKSSHLPPMFQSTAKLGVPSLKDSEDSNPPILTKASSDSMSDSDSNELTLPESPPRMNRSLLGHKSLFQEEESRSSSSGRGSDRSRSTKSRSSPVNNFDVSKINNSSIVADNLASPDDANKQQHYRSGGCGSRVDVMSQILDFFNFTCGVGAVCRDANCFSAPEQSVSVA
ncbi:hypothetical protein HJC23_006613 [Cyclotella cryptica]|uniref:Uncharacterized protein n=1 Tax=Cyclotella cryptica TaxID=29204 RepID=A0ABD3QYJ9_9STRA|eukprot:CCRYP_001020-RA/>CCRYP_001020-RA protein AED:0.31 eAED:0.33 QI:0/-1/0/1/-1/1/1/0/379